MASASSRGAAQCLFTRLSLQQSLPWNPAVLGTDSIEQEQPVTSQRLQWDGRMTLPEPQGDLGEGLVENDTSSDQGGPEGFRLGTVPRTLLWCSRGEGMGLVWGALVSCKVAFRCGPALLSLCASGASGMSAVEGEAATAVVAVPLASLFPHGGRHFLSSS